MPEPCPSAEAVKRRGGPHPGRGPAVLLALLAALTAGAAALCADDAAPGPGAAEFQRLVGGLGFGPAADPSRCAFCFDPRLSPSCPHDFGPVPGGACFCPYHGCSVFSYPPEGRAGAVEDGHERLP